jgi:hypothetical protein
MSENKQRIEDAQTSDPDVPVNPRNEDEIIAKAVDKAVEKAGGSGGACGGPGAADNNPAKTALDAAVADIVAGGGDANGAGNGTDPNSILPSRINSVNAGAGSGGGGGPLDRRNTIGSSVSFGTAKTQKQPYKSPFRFPGTQYTTAEIEAKKLQKRQANLGMGNNVFDNQSNASHGSGGHRSHRSGSHGSGRQAAVRRNDSPALPDVLYNDCGAYDARLVPSEFYDRPSDCVDARSLFLNATTVGCGSTPLIIASKNNHREATQWLMEHGADRSCREWGIAGATMGGGTVISAEDLAPTAGKFNRAWSSDVVCSISTML